MQIKTVIFLFVISSCSSVYSLRILGLVPTPGISHFKFFHPILRSLSDAGHDVTVYGYFSDKDAPSNYKDVDLSSPDDPVFPGLDLSVSQCQTRNFLLPNPSVSLKIRK